MNNPETAIHWSRNLVHTLNMGGAWGVPRSGLIFRKTGEKEMTLTTIMPFSAIANAGDADVPKTAEELLTYQRMNFACIHGQFRMAGIEVKSEVKGVPVPC